MITLVTYLPTNLSYAGGVSSHTEVSLSSHWQLNQNLALALPAKLGRMETLHAGRKGTLLHIQTVHGHYEAQLKIEKLLEWLSKKYGNYPVFVEGAAGKLNPELLNFFPKHPEWTRKTARWLAKRALVKGPELYLLKNRRAQGYGIEDETAYRKNHKQFTNVIRAGESTKNISAAFDQEIEKAAVIFSPELRSFLKRREQHELGRVSFEVWINELQTSALKNLKIDLADAAWQVHWPMLVRFFKIQTMAKEWTAAPYETEKEKFLAQIKKHTGRELYGRLEMLLGSAGQSIQLPEPETENVFVEMLRRLPRNFDYKAYPQTVRFIGLLTLQSQLNATALNDEITRLEQRLTEKLTRNETEKKRVEVFSNYRRLKKLLALQLTPSDYEAILGHETEMKPSEIAKKISVLNASRKGDSKLPKMAEQISKLDKLFDEAVAFYCGAKIRDEAMIQRVEEQLRGNPEKLAVVVTGGFHTSAMRAHFEEAGYTYGVVTPSISGPDEKGYQAYLKSMLRSEQVSNSSPNALIESAFATSFLGNTTRLSAARAVVQLVRSETRGAGVLERPRRATGRRVVARAFSAPARAPKSFPPINKYRPDFYYFSEGRSRDELNLPETIYLLDPRAASGEKEGQHAIILELDRGASHKNADGSYRAGYFIKASSTPYENSDVLIDRARGLEFFMLEIDAKGRLTGFDPISIRPSRSKQFPLVQDSLIAWLHWMQENEILWNFDKKRDLAVRQNAEQQLREFLGLSGQGRGISKIKLQDITPVLMTDTQNSILILIEALGSPNEAVRARAEEAFLALGLNAITPLLYLIEEGLEPRASRAAEVIKKIGAPAVQAVAARLSLTKSAAVRTKLTEISTAIQPVRPIAAKIAPVANFENYMPARNLPKKRIVVYGGLGAVIPRFYQKWIERYKDQFNVELVAVDLAKPDVAWQKIQQSNLPYANYIYLDSPEKMTEPESEFVREVLKSQPDGVLIVTRPDTHLKIAEWATANGMQAFIEKPLALPEHVPEFAALHRKHPRALTAIDFFFDNRSALDAVHQVLATPELADAFGQLTSIRGRMIETTNVENGREWLLNHKVSGGGLGMDMLVHLVALGDLILQKFSGDLSFSQLRVDEDQSAFWRYTEPNAPEGTETYAHVKGFLNHVAVDLGAGKGLHTNAYFLILEGTGADLEINLGTEFSLPFLELRDKAGKSLFRKEYGPEFGGDIGYHGVVKKMFATLQDPDAVTQTERNFKFNAVSAAVQVMNQTAQKMHGRYQHHPIGTNPDDMPVAAFNIQAAKQIFEGETTLSIPGSNRKITLRRIFSAESVNSVIYSVHEEGSADPVDDEFQINLRANHLYLQNPGWSTRMKTDSSEFFTAFLNWMVLRARKLYPYAKFPVEINDFYDLQFLIAAERVFKPGTIQLYDTFGKPYEDWLPPAEWFKTLKEFGVSIFSGHRVQQTSELQAAVAAWIQTQPDKNQAVLSLAKPEIFAALTAELGLQRGLKGLHFSTELGTRIRGVPNDVARSEARSRQTHDALRFFERQQPTKNPQRALQATIDHFGLNQRAAADLAAEARISLPEKLTFRSELRAADSFQKDDLKWDVFKDYGDVSLAAAQEVFDTINGKADKKATLLLPTGGSPKGMYEILVKWANDGTLDLSNVTIFMLDEYIGGKDYHDFSHEHLINKLPTNNRPKSVYVLPGYSKAAGTMEAILAYARDKEKQAASFYESEMVELGGIDLAVLGIGEDGHIGFNERGASFKSRTRIDKLSEKTRNSANNPEIREKGYTHAFTVGIETILEAKKIILIAKGKGKAPIMGQLHVTAPTEEIPASALKLHPGKNVRIIIDREAASQIQSGGHFNRVMRNVPIRFDSIQSLTPEWTQTYRRIFSKDPLSGDIVRLMDRIQNKIIEELKSAFEMTEGYWIQPKQNSDWFYVAVGKNKTKQAAIIISLDRLVHPKEHRDPSMVNPVLWKWTRNLKNWGFAEKLFYIGMESGVVEFTQKGFWGQGVVRSQSFNLNDWITYNAFNGTFVPEDIARVMRSEAREKVRDFLVEKTLNVAVVFALGILLLAVIMEFAQIFLAPKKKITVEGKAGEPVKRSEVRNDEKQGKAFLRFIRKHELDGDLDPVVTGGYRIQLKLFNPKKSSAPFTLLQQRRDLGFDYERDLDISLGEEPIVSFSNDALVTFLQERAVALRGGDPFGRPKIAGVTTFIGATILSLIWFAMAWGKGPVVHFIFFPVAAMFFSIWKYYDDKPGSGIPTLTNILVSLALGGLLFAAQTQFEKIHGVDRRISPPTFPLFRSRSEVRDSQDIVGLAKGIVKLRNANQTGEIFVTGSNKLWVPTQPDGAELLIKPSTGVITEQTVIEVLGAMQRLGYLANAIRVVTSEDIRRLGIMSKHYARHADVSHRGMEALNPAEGQAVTQYLKQMETEAGISYSGNSSVKSASSLLGALGYSASDLAAQWDEAFRNPNLFLRPKKIELMPNDPRAFRIAPISMPITAQTGFVLNGFYPAMEAAFTESEYPTVAIWLRRNPDETSALSLGELKKYVGDPNPAAAAKGTLRERALRHDPALDLSADFQPSVMNNFVHFTAPEDMPTWAPGEGELYAWHGDVFDFLKESGLTFQRGDESNRFWIYGPDHSVPLPEIQRALKSRYGIESIISTESTGNDFIDLTAGSNGQGIWYHHKHFGRSEMRKLTKAQQFGGAVAAGFYIGFWYRTAAVVPAMHFGLAIMAALWIFVGRRQITPARLFKDLGWGLLIGGVLFFTHKAVQYNLKFVPRPSLHELTAPTDVAQLFVNTGNAARSEMRLMSAKDVEGDPDAMVAFDVLAEKYGIYAKPSNLVVAAQDLGGFNYVFFMIGFNAFPEGGSKSVFHNASVFLVNAATNEIQHFDDYRQGVTRVIPGNFTTTDAVAFAVQTPRGTIDVFASNSGNGQVLTQLWSGSVQIRPEEELQLTDAPEGPPLLELAYLVAKNGKAAPRHIAGPFDLSRSEMRVGMVGKGLLKQGTTVALLEEAGNEVTVVGDQPNNHDAFVQLFKQNDVIYLNITPEIDPATLADYDKYKDKLNEVARALGSALLAARQSGNTKRKVIVLRGLVAPGTTDFVYKVIKWNAQPAGNNDPLLDVVFQPDFSFQKGKNDFEEGAVSFGLLQHLKSETEAAQTKATLAKIYPDKKIQYMDDKSAELSKELLLIYLGAKLAHFDDIAELSRRYGADLSAAAFGAGLDKRIRTLFTNPSLGFGGKLYVYLNWIRGVHISQAVFHWESKGKLHGNDTEKTAQKKQEIETILSTAISSLEKGEDIKEILKHLPRELHILFLLDVIHRINKQNILDFYGLIESEFRAIGGSLRGKKVTLLGVGYSSKSDEIVASPTQLLISKLIKAGVSDFYIADANALKSFQAWIAEKRKHNSAYAAVHFHGAENSDTPYSLENGRFYEAVQNADLTILATDSNPDLENMELDKLSQALAGRPLFDGMNLFGLRSDGTHAHKLEDVRRAGINLVFVGRPSIGPRFDGKNSSSDGPHYQLRDSESIQTLEQYRQAIESRGVLSSQPKKVAMIGGGYVGLVTAANLATLGHSVYVVDLPGKQKEMDELQGPDTLTPIFEPGLREMIIVAKENGKVRFSTKKEQAIAEASIVYLAVGTPSQDTGEVDLSYILQAARDIGAVILKNRGMLKTIVIKSTVTPDTFEQMDQALKEMGLELGKDYALVSNPEFLREGQAIPDVTEPDRTVLGFYAALPQDARRAAEKDMLELWYPLMQKHPHQILLTDTASSTIIKYLANSFLAISITFSNLFAEEADRQEADFPSIRELLTGDDRVGKNAFLWPGCGYGGSCFPKDVKALSFSSSQSTGHRLPLIDVATTANDFFKTQTVEAVVRMATTTPGARHPLKGKSVVMLGMAFKSDTDDMREASSVTILYELLKRGATSVRLHDPIFNEPNAPPADKIKDHFLDYLFKSFQNDKEFQDAFRNFKLTIKTDLTSPENLRVAVLTERFPDSTIQIRFFKEVFFQRNFIDTGRVVFEPELGRLGKADIVMLVTDWKKQYAGLDLTRFREGERKLAVFDGRNLYYPRIREIVAQGIDYLGVGTRGATLAAAATRSEMRTNIVMAHTKEMELIENNLSGDPSRLALRLKIKVGETTWAAYQIGFEKNEARGSVYKVVITRPAIMSIPFLHDALRVEAGTVEIHADSANQISKVFTVGLNFKDLNREEFGDVDAFRAVFKKRLVEWLAHGFLAIQIDPRSAAPRSAAPKAKDDGLPPRTVWINGKKSYTIPDAVKTNMTGVELIELLKAQGQISEKTDIVINMTFQGNTWPLSVALIKTVDLSVSGIALKVQKKVPAKAPPRLPAGAFVREDTPLEFDRALLAKYLEGAQVISKETLIADLKVGDYFFMDAAWALSIKVIKKIDVAEQVIYFAEVAVDGKPATQKSSEVEWPKLKGSKWIIASQVTRITQKEQALRKSAPAAAAKAAAPISNAFDGKFFGKYAAASKPIQLETKLSAGDFIFLNPDAPKSIRVVTGTEAASVLLAAVGNDGKSVGVRANNAINFLVSSGATFISASEVAEITVKSRSEMRAPLKVNAELMSKLAGHYEGADLQITPQQVVLSLSAVTDITDPDFVGFVLSQNSDFYRYFYHGQFLKFGNGMQIHFSDEANYPDAAVQGLWGIAYDSESNLVFIVEEGVIERMGEHAAAILGALAGNKIRLVSKTNFEFHADDFELISNGELAPAALAADSPAWSGPREVTALSNTLFFNGKNYGVAEFHHLETDLRHAGILPMGVILHWKHREASHQAGVASVFIEDSTGPKRNRAFTNLNDPTQVTDLAKVLTGLIAARSENRDQKWDHLDEVTNPIARFSGALFLEQEKQESLRHMRRILSLAGVMVFGLIALWTLKGKADVRVDGKVILIAVLGFFIPQILFSIPNLKIFEKVNEIFIRGGDDVELDQLMTQLKRMRFDSPRDSSRYLLAQKAFAAYEAYSKSRSESRANQDRPIRDLEFTLYPQQLEKYSGSKVLEIEGHKMRLVSLKDSADSSIQTLKKIFENSFGEIEDFWIAFDKEGPIAVIGTQEEMKTAAMKAALRAQDHALHKASRGALELVDDGPTIMVLNVRFFLKANPQSQTRIDRVLNAFAAHYLKPVKFGFSDQPEKSHLLGNKPIQNNPDGSYKFIFGYYADGDFEPVQAASSERTSESPAMSSQPQVRAWVEFTEAVRNINFRIQELKNQKFQATKQILYKTLGLIGVMLVLAVAYTVVSVAIIKIILLGTLALVALATAAVTLTLVWGILADGMIWLPTAHNRLIRAAERLDHIAEIGQAKAIRQITSAAKAKRLFEKVVQKATGEFSRELAARGIEAVSIFEETLSRSEARSVSEKLIDTLAEKLKGTTFHQFENTKVIAMNGTENVSDENFVGFVRSNEGQLYYYFYNGNYISFGDGAAIRLNAEWEYQDAEVEGLRGVAYDAEGKTAFIVAPGMIHRMRDQGMENVFETLAQNGIHLVTDNDIAAQPHLYHVLFREPAVVRVMPSPSAPVPAAASESISADNAQFRLAVQLNQWFEAKQELLPQGAKFPVFEAVTVAQTAWKWSGKDLENLFKITTDGGIVRVELVTLNRSPTKNPLNPKKVVSAVLSEVAAGLVMGANHPQMMRFKLQADTGSLEQTIETWATGLQLEVDARTAAPAASAIINASREMNVHIEPGSKETKIFPITAFALLQEYIVHIRRSPNSQLAETVLEIAITLKGQKPSSFTRIEKKPKKLTEAKEIARRAQQQAVEMEFPLIIFSSPDDQISARVIPESTDIEAGNVYLQLTPRKRSEMRMSILTGFVEKLEEELNAALAGRFAGKLEKVHQVSIQFQPAVSPTTKPEVTVSQPGGATLHTIKAGRYARLRDLFNALEQSIAKAELYREQNHFWNSSEWQAVKWKLLGYKIEIKPNATNTAATVTLKRWDKLGNNYPELTMDVNGTATSIHALVDKLKHWRIQSDLPSNFKLIYIAPNKLHALYQTVANQLLGNPIEKAANFEKFFNARNTLKEPEQTEDEEEPASTIASAKRPTGFPLPPRTIWINRKLAYTLPDAIKAKMTVNELLELLMRKKVLDLETDQVTSLVNGIDGVLDSVLDGGHSLDLSGRGINLNVEKKPKPATTRVIPKKPQPADPTPLPVALAPKPKPDASAPAPRLVASGSSLSEKLNFLADAWGSKKGDPDGVLRLRNATSVRGGDFVEMSMDTMVPAPVLFRYATQDAATFSKDAAGLAQITKLLGRSELREPETNLAGSARTYEVDSGLISTRSETRNITFNLNGKTVREVTSDAAYLAATEKGGEQFSHRGYRVFLIDLLADEASSMGEADKTLLAKQYDLVDALRQWITLPVDLEYVIEQFDNLKQTRRLLMWVSPEGILSAIREDVATPFEPRSNWGVVLNRDFKNAEVFVLSIEGSNKERPRYRIADFQTKPVRVFNVTVNTIEFQVPARSENRYTEAQTKVFEQAPDELQLKAMMFLDSMAWLYGNEAAEKIEIKFSQTPIAPHEYPKQELRFFSAEIGAGNLIVLQITSDAKGVMQTGPESYIWEAMKVASDEKEIPTAFVDGLNLFRFYQEQILTIQSESARPTAEHIVKEFARRALLKDLFNPNRVLGMQGAPMTLSYEKPQGPSLLGSKPALLFKFERGEGAEKIIHRLRFEINQKGELVYTYTTQLQKGFFGPKLSSQGWLAMDDFIQTYNRSEARNDAKAKQVAQQIERKLVNKAAFMGAAKKVAVQEAIEVFTRNYDLLAEHKNLPEVTSLPEKMQKDFFEVFGDTEKLVLGGKFGGTGISWTLVSRWGILDWRQDRYTHVDESGRKLTGRSRALIETLAGAKNSLADILERVTAPMAVYWNKKIEAAGKTYELKNIITGYVFSAPGWFNEKGELIADQENVANMKRGYRFDDPNYSDSIPSTLSLKHGIRLWGITVHDGTAHAMGQMNERLGSNMRTLLYVGPGSGIAHRLVENGQPFTGGAEVSFIQNEMPNFMNLVERRADGKTVWAADWDLAARIAAGLAKSTELSFENQTAGVAKAQRFEETLRNIGLLQPADSFDILSAIERFPEEFREMDAIIAREIGSGIAYMMMESKKKFPDTYPDLKTLPVVLGGKITTPEQLAAVKRGAQEAFAEHPKFNVTDADVEAMFSLSVINDDVREFLAALGTDLFNARSEARFEFERENIVPTITPLIERDGIHVDVASLPKYFQRLSDLGVKTVLIGGATGEFYRMTPELQKEVLEEMTRAAKAEGLRVIAHITGKTPEVTLENLKIANEAGADAFSVMPLYYFNVDENSEMTFHLRNIKAAAGNKPVMLYNNPEWHQQKGKNLPSEYLQNWRHYERLIAAIKDSSGDLDVFKGYLDQALPVYQGSEAALAEALKLGGKGGVWSTGNVTRKLQISNSVTSAELRDLQSAVNQFSAPLTVSGSSYESRRSAGLKHVLVQQGIISSTLMVDGKRNPLADLEKEAIGGIIHHLSSTRSEVRVGDIIRFTNAEVKVIKIEKPGAVEISRVAQPSKTAFKDDTKGRVHLQVTADGRTWTQILPWEAQQVNLSEKESIRFVSVSESGETADLIIEGALRSEMRVEPVVATTPKVIKVERGAQSRIAEIVPVKFYLKAEEARAKLSIEFLRGIVSQRWLQIQNSSFAQIAAKIKQLTGLPVVFAGEVPAQIPSVLNQRDSAASWSFVPEKAITNGVAQAALHPVLVDAILNSGDGRAAFELLKQFSLDSKTDVSPIVAFSSDSQLKAKLRTLMTNKQSGLLPVEKMEIENLLKLLQVEIIKGSAVAAMNNYIAQYGKVWGIAVLLPQTELLSQIQGTLSVALSQEISGHDMVVLAKIVRVLQQASLLSGEAQSLYLQRELPGIAGQNGKWTLSGIKALIAQWIAARELVATSA